MSQPPLNNPGARYWDDLVEEFDFSPDEKREIREGADHMIAEVRARRLAEVRKRQNATQVEVAAAMGVSQARVSRIEKGQLEKSEVETLAAYVKALGGKLKIIAGFRRRILRSWLTRQLSLGRHGEAKVRYPGRRGPAGDSTV
jgi:transcriptional regulator with XRE-family HTH domain